MWWIFAAALVYLFVLKLWVVHFLPGNVTGSRFKWVVGFDVGAIAELALILVPIVGFFARPRLALGMTAMTLGYYLFTYFLF